MTGLLTMERELMDNRIMTASRMPRARVSNARASQMWGNDGGSVLDGFSAAEGRYRQSHNTVHDIREQMNSNSLAGNFLRMGTAVMSGIFNAVSNNNSQVQYQKGGLAEQIKEESYGEAFVKMGISAGISYVLNKIFTPGTTGHTPAMVIARPLQQYAYAVGKQKFPWFSHRYGFMHGPSKTEKYYTLLHGGNEYALYVQRKGETNLTVAQLVERAEEFIERPMAVATDNKRANEDSRNDKFVLSGALLAYTYGDTAKTEDPRVVAGKIQKKDLFLMHQYGSSTDINIGGGMTVRVYKMPSQLHRWGFYEVGNLAYNFTDIVFYGALQKVFGKGAALEISIDQEINMHNTLHHWFWPKTKPMLEHYT